MNSRKKIWLMMAVAAMLTGCYNYDEETVLDGEPVTVELAYTFSSSVAGSQTRQADNVVVPNESNPRMPYTLSVIPMINDIPQTQINAWNVPVSKPDAPARTNSLYYYSKCNMAQNVNRCFVYGSVADVTSTGGVDTKVFNGSLIPSVSLSSVSTQDDLLNLTFGLESIYKSDEYNETAETGKDGIPADALTLAVRLTTVANTTGWKDSENNILKNLFNNFTHLGEELPGSAATVKKWLEVLAAAAQAYISTPPTAIGDEEITILRSIKTAAETQAEDIGTISDNSYPRNIHLPDGAAALRWAEVEGVYKFVPQMQTTTLDNINAVSRFAYPASLYYFINSGIKTSDEPVEFETKYEGITSTVTTTAWNAFLNDKFSGTDNIIVNSSTKAVAIETPVQYAVAQLQVSIQASAATLPDATPTPKSVNTTNSLEEPSFPLKGIIVCGQRPVNCNFVPVSSEVDVKFIYDSQVKDCNLSSASMVEACNTLVLQSPDTGSDDDKDVHIILEFQNNSDTDFEGVDGTVYPGTRFYLIGKVNHLTPASGADGTNEGRVFTKDYITMVNMTVSTLEKAYNVLPNLLSNNLEIGVQTTPKWIAATPTVIRLE